MRVESICNCSRTPSLGVEVTIVFLTCLFLLFLGWFIEEGVIRGLLHRLNLDGLLGDRDSSRARYLFIEAIESKLLFRATLAPSFVSFLDSSRSFSSFKAQLSYSITTWYPKWPQGSCYMSVWSYLISFLPQCLFLLYSLLSSLCFFRSIFCF